LFRRLIDFSSRSYLSAIEAKIVATVNYLFQAPQSLSEPNLGCSCPSVTRGISENEQYQDAIALGRALARAVLDK
jgi:hypothetical protein